MSEGILFDLFNLIGILYLDLIIFSVLIFTIVTVIPFNMKEKWEEDYFPAQISEYIVHFKWQLLLFLTLAILGMKVESLILDAYFINTYWESNGFWRLIHYSSLLVAFFSISAISGILLYFKLPGKLSYLFMTLISFLLLILFL